MTTAAAIEQKKDLDQFRYTCTGSLEVDGDVITCPYAHGENMDIKQCLATSCNGAYATLAMELGGQDPGRVHGAGGPAGFPWQSATSIPPKEALWPRRMEAPFFGLVGCGGRTKTWSTPAICWPLWGGIANDGVAVVPKLVERGRPSPERPFRRPFPTARTPIPSMERRPAGS